MKRILSTAVLFVFALLLLPVTPGFAEPPKPGPDYEWEKQHTTPEGHYVPGRWIKKKSDEPSDPQTPSKEVNPKPGAYWTPPPYDYNTGGTPTPPEPPAETYTVSPELPYILAPLAGMYLLHEWDSSLHKSLPHPPPFIAPPLIVPPFIPPPGFWPHGGYPFKPGRFDPRYGPVREPSFKKPYGDPGKGHPYKGKDGFSPYKGHPGKDMKQTPGKGHGKMKHDKGGASMSKKDHSDGEKK